ncbi:MAG: tetratricopeptide repeat protein [Anaerolineaceae bacterium]|nr:tetratricopeptide repeat protein [Anaerolineaceae bacterium]
MNLTGKQPTFRRQNPSANPYRVLGLLFLLILSLFLLRAVKQDQIQSPFAATPVPTRSAASFTSEGETHFVAGNLPAAIEAYRKAAEVDPKNATIRAELARIQVYSSASLTTDTQKRTRLLEAQESIKQAVELAPDDSSVHAVRAMVLDWLSNPNIAGDQRDAYLAEAEQAAVRALQLDNQNALALAYYSEILLDQQKYLQAEQYIRQAVERDPTLMDIHRVNGLVMETLGDYGAAIEEYKSAIAITPNLTFLYLNLGVNYRQLKQYEIALEYFVKAASINAQLGINDPIPYLAIGKTYSQTGDFFAAAQNVRKGLKFDPTNPDVYGSLGVIYFKSRNYEGAIPALKCAVRGCTAEESCEVRRCDSTTDPEIVIEGLPLSGSTVVYYFTYGSVLAGMYRPADKNNYCEEAMKVLREVRTGFANDPTIIQIVEASEQVCASFGFTR